MEHAYYRYHFHLDPTHLQEGWDRDRILGLLQERGEFAHMGTCSEIYREKAFRVRGWGPNERLPVASRLQETSLTVPVHHRLEPEQVEAIARGVRGLLRRFPRSRAPTRS